MSLVFNMFFDLRKSPDSMRLPNDPKSLRISSKSSSTASVDVRICVRSLEQSLMASRKRGLRGSTGACRPSNTAGSAIAGQGHRHQVQSFRTCPDSQQSELSP